MVSNAIRSAQTQVESLNFEMRKNVLKYDDVMNRQREVVYGERREVLEGRDIKDQVQEFLTETITAYVSGATSEGYAEDWDLDTLWAALGAIYPITFTVADLEREAGGRAALATKSRGVAHGGGGVRVPRPARAVPVRLPSGASAPAARNAAAAPGSGAIRQIAHIIPE